MMMRRAVLAVLLCGLVGCGKVKPCPTPSDTKNMVVAGWCDINVVECMKMLDYAKAHMNKPDKPRRIIMEMQYPFKGDDGKSDENDRKLTAAGAKVGKMLYVPSGVTLEAPIDASGYGVIYCEKDSKIVVPKGVDKGIILDSSAFLVDGCTLVGSGSGEGQSAFYFKEAK